MKSTAKTSIICLVIILLPSINAIADNWYMGNTHCHSTNSQTADSSPEEVVKWYHDHGYNFLLITDYDKLTDPKNIEMPPNKRQDFILIPGMEIRGNKSSHFTAMNIKKSISPWRFNSSNKTAIIKYQVKEILDAGGCAVLNHPNFKRFIKPADILPVKNLYLIEIFNGCLYLPFCYSDEKYPSCEKRWMSYLQKVC